MKCPKCGTENPNDAKSCWFCSLALTNTSTTPHQQTQEVKTSGLAITSLVLGILAPFTCFITAIPAIALGIVALVKISKSVGRLKGSGLAIAGIVIGPATLPIIALFMGIMMPAFFRVRQVSFRMVCANNMSGLGKAMLIYANDYSDMYPTSSNWCDLLIKHAEVTPIMFRCKGAPEGPCNYAMNINVEKMGLASQPDMVLLFESQPGWNQSGGFEILTTENHQGDGCNILFVDDHIQFVKTKGLQNLKWESEKSEKAKTEPNQ